MLLSLRLDHEGTSSADRGESRTLMIGESVSCGIPHCTASTPADWTWVSGAWDLFAPDLRSPEPLTALA
jgi:hypothetical protein